MTWFIILLIKSSIFNDPENEIAYGRGNLSFTTINLPMLALTANGDEAKF